MRSFLLLLTFGALAAPLHAAPRVKFPYEATIEAPEVYVRSGSGKQYYPTGKLRRGDTVVVHRHDPGGWFMIAPPAGSFCWVLGKHVQKTAANRGTVTTNNVIVRVGSFESDIREVWQRKLSQDDVVHIVGEKMLAPEKGSGPAELWYRIAPPRGEWRWIEGQAVAPPPSSERQSTDDPFDAPLEQDPSNSTQRPRRTPPVQRAEDDAPSFQKPVEDPLDREYDSGDANSAAKAGNSLGARPLVRKKMKSTSAKLVARKQDALLSDLDRLDARFQSILEQSPLEWNFDQLELDYQDLRSETDSASLQQSIDTRLARIAGYRKTQGEEQELARFQDETARRDAELAEAQRRHEAQLTTLQRPPYSGAGIIQRAALTARGAPRYVLLNQSGRVLAYLVPAAGVNLESWIGRSAGIDGPRGPNAELKADLITVNRLTPVRLTP
jgi:uncharacterized protein YraI